MEIITKKSGLDVTLVAAKLPAKMRHWLVDRVGGFAFWEMNVRAPYKTGKLRRSIKKRVSGLEVRITPTAPYSIFVEEGTRPHEIVPVNAKALRFTVGYGQVVFAKRVSHPGTAPQPFVQETADATRAKIPQLWADLWRDVERW